MFTSIDKALVAAIMGILYIVQTYTGMSFWWATPDTIATIIGLLTPVLVWSVPNKKGKRPVNLTVTHKSATWRVPLSILGLISWNRM